MKSKQYGLIAGAFAIAFVFLVSVWWLLTPKWKPLFDSQLEMSSKQAVLKKLSLWNVDYRVDNDSSDILVNQDLATSIRQRLEAEGLPSYVEGGLEVFNNSDYGLSEFVQGVNYKRAVEAELTRTINSMVGVKNSRVHITFRKESIFKDKRQNAKASIVLTLVDGYALDGNQVWGIQEITASSVEGLAPSDVIIVDDAGRVLTEDQNSPNLRHGVVAEYEKNIRSKVVGIVSGFIGSSDRVDVAVTADFDLSRKKKLQEVYIPNKENGSGYVSSKKISRTLSDRKKGADNNPTQLEEDHRYIYSKENTEVTDVAPQLKKLSVAVVVGESLTDEMTQNLRSLISSAVGIDFVRGDLLSIASSIYTHDVELISDTIVGSIAGSTEEAEITQASVHTQSQATDSLFQIERRYVWIGAALCIFLLISLFAWALKERFRVRNSSNRLSSEERAHLLNEIEHWMKS